MEKTIKTTATGMPDCGLMFFQVWRIEDPTGHRTTDSRQFRTQDIFFVENPVVFFNKYDLEVGLSQIKFPTKIETRSLMPYAYRQTLKIRDALTLLDLRGTQSRWDFFTSVILGRRDTSSSSTSKTTTVWGTDS